MSQQIRVEMRTLPTDVAVEKLWPYFGDYYFYFYFFYVTYFWGPPKKQKMLMISPQIDGSMFLHSIQCTQLICLLRPTAVIINLLVKLLITKMLPYSNEDQAA